MTMHKSRAARRQARHYRIRRRIRGDAERPRLSVFRSARHIYVQAIDDAAGHTLASASTRDKPVREQLDGSYSGNRASAAVVGRAIAEQLKARGVERVVFDRGGNRFHGRVKALADSAREAGLQF